MLLYSCAYMYVMLRRCIAPIYSWRCNSQSAAAKKLCQRESVFDRVLTSHNVDRNTYDREYFSTHPGPNHRHELIHGIADLQTEKRTQRCFSASYSQPESSLSSEFDFDDFVHELGLKHCEVGFCTLRIGIELRHPRA
jgi:hypothetical protein